MSSHSTLTSMAVVRVRSRTGLRPRGQGLFVYVLSIVIGILIWNEVASGYSAIVLSGPWVTFSRLLSMTVDGSLPLAILDSLRHMLLGFTIAMAVAFPVGFLMGRSRVAHAMLDPLVSLVYAAPAIAWAPLIIIQFGLFFPARVALVVMMCTFDMIIIVSEGVRDMDTRYVRVGRSFGVSRWQLLRHVLVPASLPFLFTALRIGVVRAVNAMVTAELFLAAVDMGSIMKMAAMHFDSASVLAVLFVMSMLGLVLQELLLWVERRVCRWLPGAES